MTPSELHAALMSLTAGFGKDANAYAMVVSGAYSDNKAMVSVYPNGSGKEGVSATAGTWEEAIAAVTVKLDALQAKHDATVVRRMALAIIEAGQFTPESLTAAGFSQADVDAHGDAARAAASELAKPFLPPDADAALIDRFVDAHAALGADPETIRDFIEGRGVGHG